MKSTLKSIGAVVAGFAVVVVLSTVTDLILEKVGIMPMSIPLVETGPLLLALAYRTVYTILGGFVTAKLAPQNGMKHAIILGSIGTVVGILGAIAMADLGAPWYAWAVALEGLPCVWIGAKLARA